VLVLSRLTSEAIDINGGFKNGGISIQVVSVRGERVRLGIDAPKSVVIHRREVQVEIDKEAEKVAE